ncbi:50S ribosomal protein L19e [Halovenus rubra]|uniref:50S ribosomal protein L19e n=2 Tax=Halovenus rubra TaxID=869890 RepID=A0ACC7E1B7_9EURY|nr:50S ribosomal protein L19e [Halovenus rubra]
MTDLKAQKRLASDVLDVGKNKLWFDPDRQGDIAEAITREDIRELVDEGVIRADPPQGNSRGRARERQKKQSYGHQKGPGSRKGKAGGRQDPKEEWQSSIRALRTHLRDLRDDGELDRTQYRDLYDKAGGGEFDSVADLERYIDETYGEA